MNNKEQWEKQKIKQCFKIMKSLKTAGEQSNFLKSIKSMGAGQ